MAINRRPSLTHRISGPVGVVAARRNRIARDHVDAGNVTAQSAAIHIRGRKYICSATKGSNKPFAVNNTRTTRSSPYRGEQRGPESDRLCRWRNLCSHSLPTAGICRHCVSVEKGAAASPPNSLFTAPRLPRCLLARWLVSHIRFASEGSIHSRLARTLLSSQRCQFLRASRLRV